MSGKVSSERVDVEFPEILYGLWDHFQNMHRCRGVGMAGALSITYLDIQAYSQLKQIRFEGWELDAIRCLDIIFLNSQNEK